MEHLGTQPIQTHGKIPPQKITPDFFSRLRDREWTTTWTKKNIIRKCMTWTHWHLVIFTREFTEKLRIWMGKSEENGGLPSGKRWHSYWTSPFVSWENSRTFDWAMFNSYVTNYRRVASWSIVVWRLCTCLILFARWNIMRKKCGSWVFHTRSLGFSGHVCALDISSVALFPSLLNKGWKP